MYDEDGFVFGMSTVEADLIDKVTIEWVAGQVNISKGDSNEIEFNESSSTRLNETTALVSKVEGSELIIRFTKNPMRGAFKNLKKTLDISLPKKLKKFSVKTISAGIFVSELGVDGFATNSVSGIVVAENLVAPKVAFKAVSGEVDLQGSFDLIKGKSVSGKVNMISSICPSRIWLENISGANFITIPENDGFAAQIESISGRVKTDFQVLWKGKNMLYGNGNSLFMIKTISGSTAINQLK